MKPGRESFFEILEETRDHLVVNKTGGLVCHPTKGDAFSSLIGRLKLYFEGHPEVRPSFVNRLDRETSGVILVAKNPQTHASFQRVFQQGGAEKVYLAIVHGVPALAKGEINQPIGRENGGLVAIRQAVRPDGAPSLTRWRLLDSFGNFSVLEARPKTGRLHQIRTHLSWIGHPIVGDKLYGPSPQLYLEFVRTGWTSELQNRLLTPRQMLHAAELRLTRADSSEIGCWKSPLPADMREFLNALDPPPSRRLACLLPPASSTGAS